MLKNSLNRLTFWLLVVCLITALSFLIWWFLRNRAVTTTRATPEMIETGLASLSVESYSLMQDPESSVYSLNCTLESIDFLKENAYIQIGTFAITVTGQCMYLDTNQNRQTITVALVVQDMVNKTEWFPPNWIFQGRTSQDFIQERFAETTTLGGGEIKPGSVISAIFNLPNPLNQALVPEAQHHAALMNDLYTQEMIDAFVNTKQPSHLPNQLLVPFSVQSLEVKQ